MIVEELIAILGFKMTGSGEVSRFQKQLEGVKRTVTTMVTTAAVAGGALVAGLAKGAITTGATFEKLKTTLETIEGSSDKANQSLDWVTDFATKTPYELEEVADAFVKMKAYGLDPTDGSLRALGDASSAMGKDFMAAIEAMADATTGENERLKEFGIRAEKAGDQITYKWMQNGKQMTRTVKKDGKEISKALTEIFQGRFAGAMDKQSRTWNGMMSNLSDKWQSFQRMIADAGAFEYAKEGLRGILEWIDRLEKNGTLQAWATGISNVIISVSESFKRIGSLIGEVLGWFGKLIGVDQSLGPLMTLIAAFALAFAPVPTAIAAVILALDDLAAWMNGEASVIGAFIDLLKVGWEEVKKWVSSAVDAVKEFFTIDLTEVGANIINSLWEGMKQKWEDFKAWVSDAASSITSIWSGVKVSPSGAGGENAGPPARSPGPLGKSQSSSTPGQSSPDAPGIKKGASLSDPRFNAALARTNVASLASGVRGGGGSVMTDNSRTEISVKVEKTDASPQDIAAAIKTAQAENGLKNIFFTSASPATA